MTTQQNIEDAVAAAEWGKPSAAKRGRNPAFPYVPVVVYPARTANLAQGRAYSTREEAVAFCQKHIEHCKQITIARLAEPRNRALREQYGLPRDILTSKEG